MQYRSSWMTEELDVFRDQFRKFLAKDLAPHAEKWRDQKMVDRSAWRALGEMGALLPSVPEAYGGLGGTFAHEAAVLEDLESVVPGVTSGVGAQRIVAHYILDYGSEEQKRALAAAHGRGELVGAIAMTEPGTGSDLQGVRTTARQAGRQLRHQRPEDFHHQRPGRRPDHRRGAHRRPGAKGLSLIVVETEGNEGFRRGRNLDKIGLQRQTRPNCSSRMRWAAGEPARRRGGQGLHPVDAAAALRAAVARRRRGGGDGARGQADGRLHQGAQGVRQAHHRVPEHRVQAGRAQDRGQIARVFVDWCIERLIAGELDTVTAAMAKWWAHRSRSTSSTSACSSTAATATWRNIRSRACASTPGSRKSTPAPTRS